ncbi:MAG TPA: phosphoadenosine phosphosulfate reductase, partial [Limnobacter sp.]|nr:phosphoadenosine phosphosulfate reductase [Limnobacter sp.]
MSNSAQSRFHSVEAAPDNTAVLEQPIAVFRGPHQPATDIAAKVQALEALLTQAASEFDHIALASSLAAEDNVLFDAIARLKLDIRVFSLNTGRLHQQTLDVAPALQAKYGHTVQWFEPKADAVE